MRKLSRKSIPETDKKIVIIMPGYEIILDLQDLDEMFGMF